MSGRGRSSNERSATSVSLPVSVMTGPGPLRDKGGGRTGEPAEHLVRPDRVERGETVVDQDRDVHCGLRS